MKEEKNDAWNLIQEKRERKNIDLKELTAPLKFVQTLACYSRLLGTTGEKSRGNKHSQGS